MRLQCQFKERQLTFREERAKVRPISFFHYASCYQLSHSLIQKNKIESLFKIKIKIESVFYLNSIA